MANETLSPISAAKPPVANPITLAAGGERSPTIKLKPVIRKPGEGGPAGLKVPLKPVVRPGGATASATPAPAAPAVATATPAPAAPKALDQLKSVTQKLKDVTQEIPQQAILRKTGIIAEQTLTEAQKQASKARTARISLADAIGVAPVKNESAPMKTIRIKRPLDLPNAGGAKPPVAVAAPVAPVVEAAPAPAAEEPKKAEAAPTLTQRKTLKIARPGAGAPRPGAPKIGAVKKPDGAAPAAAAAPADGEVADIPDIPDMPATMAPVAPMAAGEKDVPVFVGIISLIVQVAACAVMGMLAYMLYTATSVAPF